MAQTFLDPTQSKGLSTLVKYRRPTLVWSSITQVNVDDVMTTNQVDILFPDGEYRSETSSTLYNFVITRNAVLTGSKQSGLRTGLSEATNTWYAIYAVKAQDSTGIVAVGDTTLPRRANISTLNTAYGTNSWIYLGVIANGNNSNATGDIFKFSQSGSTTRLDRALTTGNVASMTGIRLASTASATTLTWTYAAGGSISSAEIPNSISVGHFQVAHAGRSGVSLETFDSSQNKYYNSITTGNAITIYQFQASTADGIRTRGSTVQADPMDINLVGFIDDALGVGPNPLV